jgi:hypothetical protein
MAVGAERQVNNLAAVPAEDRDLLAIGRIPEPDGAVVAGGGEAMAVGAEGDPVDELGMPRSVTSSRPDRASKSFTTRSAPPVAIRAPSGL